MGLQARGVSPYSTPDVLAIASAFSMEKSLIVSCCSHKAHHENSFMIFGPPSMSISRWQL